MAEGDNTPILEFGEKILYMPAKPARGGKVGTRFHPGVFVGMLNSSSEAVVVTEQGTAITTRTANIRRIPESERWDADRILGMRAVPWSPGWHRQCIRHSSRNGETRGDGAPGPRRGAVGEQGSEDLLAQSDFEQWGLSEGCPGCRYLRIGQGRQQAHSESCRRRIEGLLRGDSAGSTWLAATDERINRALADAVERHATRIQE